MLSTIGIGLHFFVPLSPAITAGVVIAGVAGLVVDRAFFGSVSAAEWWFGGVLLLACVTQVRLDRPHPDAGIYYVQTILWTSERVLTPGLANIAPQLGFNNAWLALAALLGRPASGWAAVFALNAVIAVFGMLAIFRVIGEPRSGERQVARLTAALMAAAFSSGLAFRGSLGSLSTDFAPFVVACDVGVLFLLAGETAEVTSAVEALVLAAFALTLKVSSLPLLGGAGLLFLLTLHSRGATWRLVSATMAVVAALLLPWTLRGLALSGCVFFPSSQSCLAGLPWTVPTQLADSVARYVLDYARGTTAAPHGLHEWISPMVAELWANHHGRMLMAVAAAGMLLLVRSLRGPVSTERSRFPKFFWLPLAVGVGWTAFAVVRGPALRFYEGGLAMFAFTLLALGVVRLPNRLSGRLRPRVLELAVIGIIALQFVQTCWRSASQSPGPWPAMSSPVTVRRTTTSGLDVIVPVDEYCWDAQPICTPYFDPSLHAVPWLGREYFVGANVVAYRNAFPPRPTEPDVR
jgi:hypothetical protein